jgi:hypothetical protein
MRLFRKLWKGKTSLLNGSNKLCAPSREVMCALMLMVKKPLLQDLSGIKAGGPFVHYVRKAHSRCACTKNGDAQVARLHHCISHYRVIGDVRSGTSSISIHERRTTSERVTI